MSERNNPLFISILFLTLALASCKENVSSVGNEILGCLTECSVWGSDIGDSVRVITLNLYHGYPDFKHLQDRLNLASEQIKDSEADIVLLQEVPWQSEIGLAAEFLAERLEFNFVYVRANGNYSLIRFEEGLAILSRFPLNNPIHTEILPKPGGFENRAALGVTALIPGGPINLVTTHLTRRKNTEINAEQVASLMEFVKSMGTLPAVVSGDLNAEETSEQIVALKEYWIDAYRLANPQSYGPTCCLVRDRLDQVDPGQPRVRVDYVFLVPNGSNWHINEAGQVFNAPRKNGNGYLWVSNHIGVLVDTTLTN